MATFALEFDVNTFQWCSRTLGQRSACEVVLDDKGRTFYREDDKHLQTPNGLPEPAQVVFGVSENGLPGVLECSSFSILFPSDKECKWHGTGSIAAEPLPSFAI